MLISIYETIYIIKSQRITVKYLSVQIQNFFKSVKKWMALFTGKIIIIFLFSY